MDLAVSAKPASTAADARVVAAAVADNGVPAVNTTGTAVGMFGNFDLVATCTGAGGSFQFTLWWWYGPASTWVADANVTDIPCTTATGPVGVVLNHSASSAAYIQVHTFAGGGSADAWLIGRGKRATI